MARIASRSSSRQGRIMREVCGCPKCAEPCGGRHPFGATPRRRAPGTVSVGARRRRAVLLVGHVLTPGDRVAGLVVLLHGDVGHEAVGAGAVPVVLPRLEEDAVAGPNLLDGAA